MMNDDRRRQVETTKKNHGDDFYKRIGEKSSGKGQTFKDPEKAKAAARKRWDKQRKIRDDAVSNNEQSGPDEA